MSDLLDAGKELVDAYLQAPDAVQIAGIVAGAGVSQLYSQKMQSFLRGAFRAPILEDAIQAMQTTNALMEVLSDPNVGGIPIKAENETCTRQVEVAESMIVVQSDGSKDFVTDNAVPRPRQWSISGYLSTMLRIDSLFTIKPSLIMQLMTLDAFACARRPVWYKNSFNQFYKVLIESFNWEQRATVTNSVAVSLTLKEFNAYTTKIFNTDFEPVLVDAAAEAKAAVKTALVGG